jgi:hypothetical protein
MIYKLDFPNEPDFSKTQIYIIRCADEAVSGCYVGATTDFAGRRSQHKYAVANASARGGENRKLYCAIRQHGGWSNYTMTVVDLYPECRSLTESRIRERLWFDICGARLNAHRPYITDEERAENHTKAHTIWKAKHKDAIHAYEKRRYAAKRQRAEPATTATTAAPNI